MSAAQIGCVATSAVADATLVNRTLGTHVAKCAARNTPAVTASRRSRASRPRSSSRCRSIAHGTRTPDAIALRQNAMARVGAAVAAISGADVDTAAIAIVSSSRSAGGGAASTAGASRSATRRVSRMDQAAITALVEESAKKSGLLWVRAAGPRHRAQPMWQVWNDGAIYVLTGGIEHPAREARADRALVILRSKDKGPRLLTIEAAVDVVEPGSDEWSALAPLLVAQRLNLPDGEAAPERWRRECVGYRLRPTGEVAETPDEPSTSSHAAEPPATPARTRVPRPLHLRRRPRRSRGGGAGACRAEHRA